MKRLKYSLVILSLMATIMIAAFSWPVTGLANIGNFKQANQYLNATAGKAGVNQATDLVEISALIVKSLLGLFGVFFFVLILYAGFMWMTAAGNDSKVAKAKTLIVQAIIGLIIIMTAFAIANYLTSSLDTVVPNPPASSPTR